MRLAGRKQASICLTSFSRHVPAGTPRSPHEASRSDTRSDNGSLHSGRSMQNIYPRTPHVAAADSSKRCGQIFPGGGMLCEKPLQKIGFRRALLLMKPAHTGHHPGAVPGFRPSPGNSEETTTRVLTEEISVLFRVPTWDPTHPGSPVSRALPGNTPTQGPTREGKPGFFLGGGGNPGRNPGHGLGKTRERGGFRVFPGWYCWGLKSS